MRRETTGKDMEAVYQAQSEVGIAISENQCFLPCLRCHFRRLTVQQPSHLHKSITFGNEDHQNKYDPVFPL